MGRPRNSDRPRDVRERSGLAENDRRRIARPVDWPLRPYLPMRRDRDDGGMPELGVLAEGAGTKVFRTPWYAALRFGTDNCELVEYTTVREMLAHGWRID